MFFGFCVCMCFLLRWNGETATSRIPQPTEINSNKYLQLIWKFAGLIRTLCSSDSYFVFGLRLQIWRIFSFSPIPRLRLLFMVSTAANWNGSSRVYEDDYLRDDEKNAKTFSVAIHLQMPAEIGIPFRLRLQRVWSFGYGFAGWKLTHENTISPRP